MKPESIEILERHLHHWHTLKHAGYVSHLDQKKKEEIESVVRSEQDPRYHENLWCGECVANMIRRIYTAYEQHLLAQESRKLVDAALRLVDDPASAKRNGKGQKGPKK